MCVWVCVCVCVSVCVRVCVCMCECVCVCARACILMYVSTSVWKYTCSGTYLSMYVHSAKLHVFTPRKPVFSMLAVEI